MVKRSVKFAVALAAAAALALTGCSSSNSNGGAQADEESVFVAALGTNPPHFNRNLTTEIGTMVVGSTIFESLVSLDDKFELHPKLAAEWSVNPEATEYTFKLRDGVKWHDGEPFTSADVKFTFDTYLPLGPQSSSYAKYIESVETPDDSTVIVKFNTPFAPFVEALASIWIMPEHIFNDGKDIVTHEGNLHPIGTGPYKFESFTPGDRAVVVKNDDYWDGKVDVDRMVFSVMPDANARLLALRAGEIDFIYSSYADKSSFGTLEEEPEKYAFLPSLGGFSTVTAHVNSRNPILADPAVRRALYSAVDRQSIVDKAYYGYAEVTRGPIPAQMEWAVSPDVDFRKEFPFDLEAADKALDAAGYPKDASGKRFSLTLATPSEYTNIIEAANVIKSDFAQLGIDVNLVQEEFGVWTERVYKKHEFDISLIFYTTFEDPSLGITRAYVCNPDNVNYRNASGVCDEELDADFARAGQSGDRADRSAAFKSAEQRIAQLMHTWPVVVDETLSVGRSDRFDFTEAFATHQISWGKLKTAGSSAK